MNGYILDENQNPVPGALINCGGKEVYSDSKGFFVYKEKLTVNKDYAVIRVSRDGYLDGYRTFTPARDRTGYYMETIILLKAGVSTSVAFAGGTVTTDSVRLTFPENVIVRTGGTPYTGTIHVQARYFNPSATWFALSIPGSLSGLNSAGTINALQSFGMAAVELTDDAGVKLEIATGKTVKMEIPAPAGGPAAIPLWHFNETYGLWIQQGEAIKQGNYYVAEVNHFSTWNIDIESNSFELRLKFENADQLPVAGLHVNVTAGSGRIAAAFMTDNKGEATLINCPASHPLQMLILSSCDTIALTLSPVTSSRSETVILSSQYMQSYQFTGILSSCNNSPLPDQPFQLFISGNKTSVVLNGITDDSGMINIATALPSCVSATLTSQSAIYYNDQNYFSMVKTVSPGVNNYDVNLCGQQGAGGVYNDSDIVTIPDPELLSIVRTAIHKPDGVIRYSDIKYVERLNYLLEGPGIQSLVGLEYFTALDTLLLFPKSDVTQNLANLSPIKDLVSLRYLEIRRTNLSDLSQLQKLTSLTSLILSGEQITDVAPLSALVNLKSLWLFSSPLQDVTPLANLVNLIDLSLYSQNLADLSSLKTLINLRFFSITSAALSDLSVVQYFTSLTTLTATQCQVEDITPLKYAYHLEAIYMDSNLVSDISTIKVLPELLIAKFSRNKF